jgi:hypothetical protein
LANCLVMSLVYDGFSVGFIREAGACFQNLARSLGFGNARFSTCFRGFVWTALFAAVEIEQRNFVAKVAVLGNRSATAVFGIAWMAAGYDNFQFLRTSERAESRRAREKVTAREKTHSNYCLLTIE